MHAVAIGLQAGKLDQGANAIAIGPQSGGTEDGESQKEKAVAIGGLAGMRNQAASSIAVGYGAGQQNQGTNSIILNASGLFQQSTGNRSIVINATNTQISDPAATGLFVAPIANSTTSNYLYYNTSTKQITYGTGSGGGDVVSDTTPQLGGNLDVNGKTLTSVANGNIELDPNGSGKVVLKGNSTKGSGQIVLNCENNSHGIILKGPPHSAGASYTLVFPNTVGTAGQVLKTDGAGNLDWTSSGGGSGGTSVTGSGATAGLKSQQI